MTLSFVRTLHRETLILELLIYSFFSQFDSLSGLALPSKKTFNNMSKEFLEKRKVGLNAYLQTLLNPIVLNNHRGLLDVVYGFLEHIVWEKENVQILKKVGRGRDYRIVKIMWLLGVILNGLLSFLCEI